MFTSRYFPCAECGASVERVAVEEHRCTSERLADYLDTGQGQFDVWLAARQVRAA